MKNSLKTTTRWSTLAVAMGILSVPAFQARAAIYWPGQTGDGNEQADYEQGYTDGQEDCRLSPRSCGVKIYPMIKDQGYGETEPNDHILNADGLLLGRFYHANSFTTHDEDWYYVVTDKRNQKLTLYFLGDAQDFAVTSGWLIQIRDLNGNVIASFDSTSGNTQLPDAPTDDNPDTPDNPDNPDNPPPPEQEVSPVDQAKVAEVTLPKLGTYYISVKPLLTSTTGGNQTSSGELRGYNIAATLENTGQITPDPDGTFFDTEVEPNDQDADANTIRSNVPMVGVFDRTLVKTWIPPRPAGTEIQYFYVGCNENDPDTIPLGLKNCNCDLTSIDNAGNIVPSNPNNVPSQQPADACYAQEVTIPGTEGEWQGRFAYDIDTYVFHSQGNEQLRLQICTRTECQFEQVHLKVTRENSAIILAETPLVPGQTIDLGAVVEGDYYIQFSAQKTDVESDTGNPIEIDLIGPYDVLLMSTRLPIRNN